MRLSITTTKLGSAALGRAVYPLAASLAIVGFAGCSAFTGGDTSGDSAQRAQAGSESLAECSGEYEITTTIRLNVRSAPGIRNRIVKQVEPGARLKRAAGAEARKLRNDWRCGAAWLPVEEGGQTLWICGQPAWVRCVEAALPEGDALTCDDAKAVTACGGKLRGTYESTKSCAVQEQHATSPFGDFCPEAVATTDDAITTTHTFSGGEQGTMVQRVKVASQGTVEVPRTCLSEHTCDDFADLLDKGTADVACAKLASGDIGCRCTFTDEQTVNETWNYQIEGATLKLAKQSDPSFTNEVDYCVQGANLVMWEGSYVTDLTTTSCSADPAVCDALGDEYVCDSEFVPADVEPEGMCLKVTSTTTAEPYHRTK